MTITEPLSCRKRMRTPYWTMCGEALPHPEGRIVGLQRVILRRFSTLKYGKHSKARVKMYCAHSYLFLTGLYI